MVAKVDNKRELQQLESKSCNRINSNCNKGSSWEKLRETEERRKGERRKVREREGKGREREGREGKGRDWTMTQEDRVWPGRNKMQGLTSPTPLVEYAAWPGDPRAGMLDFSHHVLSIH